MEAKTNETESSARSLLAGSLPASAIAKPVSRWGPIPLRIGQAQTAGLAEAAGDGQTQRAKTTILDHPCALRLRARVVWDWTNRRQRHPFALRASRFSVSSSPMAFGNAIRPTFEKKLKIAANGRRGDRRRRVGPWPDAQKQQLRRTCGKKAGCRSAITTDI